MGFHCGSAGKESACNAGDLGLIPGLGRSLGEGKGYLLQYSGLENSMDYIVHGVAKSRTRLSDFHFTILGAKNSKMIQKFKFLPRSEHKPKWCCCSVSQLCPTLWDHMDCSRPGLPVPHHLLEFAQVHVHCVSDAVQPSHPLTPSSPSALKLSQNQGLIQWVVCSYQMTKIL